MAIDLRLVDKIDPSPATRLNLNDGTKWVFQRKPMPDFAPPPLKRAVVDTLLRQGARIAASAYDNRRLRFDLVVQGTDEDDLATELQKLNRELDREQNILKYQPDGATNPVYFRTLRSPISQLAVHAESQNRLRCKIDLLAEPFAYGEMVQLTGTIYNDPAAVANGVFFEITGAGGDIPTPLWIKLTSVARPLHEVLMGVRRHGTPALYWQQAEDMWHGNDTWVQANDALMSGAGSNWSLTTFATTTMMTRLMWAPIPGAGSSVEYRGLYRAFVRVRRTGSADTMTMRLAVSDGTKNFFLDSVDVPKTTDIQLIDLGILSIPFGPDPVRDGFTGEMLLVNCSGTAILLQAENLDDTEDLGWDYLVLVPADEEFAIGDFAAVGGPTHNTFDGPNDLVYGGTAADDVRACTGKVPLVGSVPLVTPNQTNLYVTMRGIARNFLAGNNADMTYVARYWPRWLYVRP